MEENSISITVSKVIEYLYCPRTIFFLDVLGIPKNETEDFSKVRFFVNEILEIINKGLYPLDVENKNKCKDCCYRKFCNVD